MRLFLSAFLVLLFVFHHVVSAVIGNGYSVLFFFIFTSYPLPEEDNYSIVSIHQHKYKKLAH